MSDRDQHVSYAARITAGNLRADHAAACVLEAFQRDGVSSLLLKGPSLARWLYPEGGVRAYIDCDVLVPGAGHSVAVAVLVEQGYEAALDERRMPGWWREHAVGFWHARAGIVDLHRTLPGVGVDDQVVWSVLFERAERLLVGHFSANVLSIDARALHVALHAAQHGEGLASSLSDLDRALELAGEATWRSAARLAQELQATEAFAAGLSLRPAGRALISSLGVPEAQSVGVALQAAGARPEALTVDRFVRASGVRARAAIIRHKLLPPGTFMRAWAPDARQGGWRLWSAYGGRVAWVIRQAAPAVRTWRRARRELQQARTEADDGRPHGALRRCSAANSSSTVAASSASPRSPSKMQAFATAARATASAS